MPPRSGGSEADVPRKRSNCRVFATHPSPIIPRSGSLREPMRGHCGARLIDVATGTHARSPLGVLNASWCGHCTLSQGGVALLVRLPTRGSRTPWWTGGCCLVCLGSAGPGELVMSTLVAVSAWGAGRPQGSSEWVACVSAVSPRRERVSLCLLATSCRPSAWSRPESCRCWASGSLVRRLPTCGRDCRCWASGSLVRRGCRPAVETVDAARCASRRHRARLSLTPTLR